MSKTSLDLDDFVFTSVSGKVTEPASAVEIPGDIPNRGLLQADINLHGLTYLQKINDANVKTNGKPSGIQIPGR
jgi:hypothetical protein